MLLRPPVLLLALAALAAPTTATAQVVQTANTGTAIQSAGCASYFDFQVLQRLTLTGFDFQCNDPVITPGLTATVYIRPGGRSGRQTVAADWIQWGPVFPITSAGPLAWTPILGFPPLPLNASGPFGIALVTNGSQVATGGGNGTYPSVPVGSSEVRCGEVTVLPFTGQVLTNLAANVRLTYNTLPWAPGVISPFATAFPYGDGCYRQHASFYEYFTPGSTLDLAGTSLTLTPNSCGGYDVTAGTRPYYVGSPNPTPIIQNDEGTSTWSPVPPMPLPGGGSTGTFRVHANGVVSSGTATVVGKTPSPAAWLAMPDTVWGDWHDFDATQAAGPVTIEIVFEGLNKYWVFTWRGVRDFGFPGSVNNFQMEFNTTNGQVHMHWGAMSGLGGDHLVGYSPGGASTDPGSTDLTLVGVVAFATCADDEPLTLAADPRPIVPSLFDLVVSHIPTANPTLVVILYGTATPPLDLGFIGAPGCFAHLNPISSLFTLIGTNTVATQPVQLPNIPAWLGLRIDLQAAAFAPVNQLGMVTSNGLTLYFGGM